MVDQASELEALELILTDANAEPTKLSYALIKSITTNFSKEIGRGGFGVVYLGVLRNEKVAVKKLFIEQDFSDELFVDEVNSLVRAKHNNIVRFLGYCADTQGELVKFDGRHVMAEVRQRLLCFEYVPNGNLHDYIKGISHGDEWQIRYKMIKGICHGLQYLHKERITHLDLKPENVLLDAYMEPKITDFGLSRVFDEGQSRVFTKNVLGTRGYIAPEIIDKGEISFKSDIFALGIVVSKLLVGRNNYEIENWHESLDVDCTKAKSCIQIAQSCMDTDQHKRPTAEEIIKKLNEMESPGSSVYRTNSPDSENLIQVEPLELHFHLEPNTHISASQKLKLANITDDYVAFNVMEWSSMAKYGFSWSGPSRGILLPWSTHELGLIREAHEMSPLSVQCNDVLIVRSTVVSEGFKTHYITPDMFKTHMGRKVHEVKLGILVAPTLAESSALASDTLSMPPAENQDHGKAKEEFHRLGLSAHERPHGTDAQISQETETSTERLAINPLELRFPFEQNKLIACALYLRNNTDRSFAFRLVPGSPKRYYEKGLCGNIPPKLTYTLFVRMRGCQEPPPHKDEFVIQSSVMSDDELKDIRKGRADIDYCNFFADVKEKNVRKVHELTLQAVFEPQRETTNVEIIPMENFTKIFSMDVHPTKPWIITNHFESHFCIWNYQNKPQELVHEQKGLPFLTARFIEREQWIVAGTAGDCKGRIYVYNYDTWEEVKNLKAHNESITSLAIHPTKTYVLSASHDYDIELWDWKKGRKSAQTFKGHKGSVYQIAFNPHDASIFASVSQDRTIKIWNLDSPRSNLTLTGHTCKVRCLDYFYCGNKQFLITGSDDNTAKIWDLQTNICVKTLEGHTDRVSTVCSHPMLPKLMTGSFDGTVRLWNSTTFMLEGVLNFNLKEVHALRYGIPEDFRRVMIGHRDGLAIMKVDCEGHLVGAGSMENAIRYV